MKKTFEEPKMECVKITSEVIADVAGGDLGNTSNDPFEGID